MTVSDKLTKIQQIKNSIRFAANSKGAEISESDSFEDYPGKIEAIPAAQSELPELSNPVPIATYKGDILYRQIRSFRTSNTSSDVASTTFIDVPNAKRVLSCEVVLHHKTSSTDLDLLLPHVTGDSSTGTVSGYVYASTVEKIGGAWQIKIVVSGNMSNFKNADGLAIITYIGETSS